MVRCSRGAEVLFKDLGGQPTALLLTRENESELEIVSAASEWSFSANGDIYKLVFEAYRISLALRGKTTAFFAAASPDREEPTSLRQHLSFEERAQTESAFANAAESELSGTARSAGSIESFFVEALNLLDGQISVREPGRYEVTQLPATLADIGARSGFHRQEFSRYKYLTFSSDLTDAPNRPTAEFIDLSHPLLHAMVRLVLDGYQKVLRRGTVLVDAGNGIDGVTLLLHLECVAEEMEQPEFGGRGLMHRQLQSVHLHTPVDSFALVGQSAITQYLPLTQAQWATWESLSADCIPTSGFEERVLQFAVSQLVPRHMQQVRHTQKELTARTIAAVRNRHRGQRTLHPADSVTSDFAGLSTDQLEGQLQQHMEDLEQKCRLRSLSPFVVGGPKKSFPAGDLWDWVASLCQGSRLSFMTCGAHIGIDSNRWMSKYPATRSSYSGTSWMGVSAYGSPPESFLWDRAPAGRMKGPFERSI